MSGVDKAFDEFLKVFDDKAARHSARSTLEERIVEEKNNVLQPVRLLLKRLIDLGLIVHHRDHHNPQLAVESPTPQPFTVYEDQSSPLWYPGVSLFFDHPAEVEIAVPNERERNDGVVVIRSSSMHPDAHMFTARFTTIDEACLALSKFLAKNTVRLERAPLHRTPR